MSCNDISLSFGNNKILENINFSINHGEKAGLIGINGAGKTTLLRILSGNVQPDTGEIFISKDKKTGYLEQSSSITPSGSIWDELASSYSSLIKMENQIKSLEKSISAGSIEGAPASLMNEYAVLTERFSRCGGYEYNSRIKGVLKGLEFDEDQFYSKVSSLSGGQKTRLRLAKLLLEEPDILLLDEPTNHLDINALEWLEDFLKNYKKTVLLISHDRYFLDIVSNKIIELENCRCKVYNGNYTAFAGQKALERETHQKQYELQQKEINRMEAFIEQQKRWNREKNIKAAVSRQKAIGRLDRIEKPGGLPDKMRINFTGIINSPNEVLFVDNLSKEFSGRYLFNNVCFTLRKREKIFISGPNGCGKSTLLKILAGRLEKTAGNYEYGCNVSTGYYDQELEGLNENNTVLEEVWNNNEKLAQSRIRSILASFLFMGDAVFKPVSILSGGEKSRVALMKLILSGANLLILDEPTNHLDINSREALENALSEYAGTIIAVSHDRYFINKLATRILEFNGSTILDYKGDYAYYLEKRGNILQNGGNSPERQRISVSKQEYMEKKEELSRKRKLERQFIETEKQINDIEMKLNKIAVEMLLEGIQSDHIKLMELMGDQDSLKRRLEELYKYWERLAQLISWASVNTL